MSPIKMKAIRIAKELTQEQFGLTLGFNSGIAKSRVYDFESGRRPIPAEIAEKAESLLVPAHGRVSYKPSAELLEALGYIQIPSSFDGAETWQGKQAWSAELHDGTTNFCVYKTIRFIGPDWVIMFSTNAVQYPGRAWNHGSKEETNFQGKLPTERFFFQVLHAIDWLTPAKFKLK